jgi:peroxiredoxin
MKGSMLPFLTTMSHGGAGDQTPASRGEERKLLSTADDKLGTAPVGSGLRAGDRAPDAALSDITGTTRQLSEFYRDGPVFVIFYRGGWCPYCNLQLHELAKAQPEFDRRKVTLVAISVDRLGEEAKTQAREGVPFPMLSDPELIAHRAFNVIHVAGEAQQQRLAKLGIELNAYSGASHHSFAIPSIFLVDRTGTIQFAHVDEDYETRPNARQLLMIYDAVPRGDADTRK